MKIVGVDPGLANLGISLAEHTNQFTKVLKMGLHETDKNVGANETASEANFRRAGQLYVWLDELFSSPLFLDVNLIAAEAMSFPPNAANAAKMAMSWGVIASISKKYRIPVLHFTPKAIKLAVGQRNDLSKKDVQEALRLRFPDANFEELLKGILKGLWEHPFDSLGAIVASLSHNLVLLSLSLRSE